MKVTRAKQPKRRKFSARNKDTSIFFLVWSAFSLVAFVVTLIFSLPLPYLIRETYERRIAHEVVQKGDSIHKSIVRFGGVTTNEQYDSLVRHLATINDVEVYILFEDGSVLFPFSEISEGVPTRTDFSAEIATLIDQLAENDGTPVTYSAGKEMVYGARLVPYQNQETYLYVAESMQILATIVRDVKTRIWSIAVLVFLITFAISSALAGFLVDPITKLTAKTKRFAQGDFEVDFLEGTYGSEITALAQTLNFARDEISKSDKMQKELIANVSHDFKTPLTMIKSYASMIREISGDIPEKRDKHAQVIEEEADRLTALVNDVLELSKLNSGVGELKLVRFNLSEYVYEILERFGYLRETQGYEFTVDVDNDVYVTADELKIGRVLYNLVSNAVNYTGEDKRVYVRLKCVGGVARFSVKDTGAGIKKEDLATIWERYYRSNQAHKRPVNGTGLGLSIVKGVLERHGFDYGVDCKEGEGCEFYVDFPC